MANRETSVPLGAIFYNTISDHSRFSIDAVISPDPSDISDRYIRQSYTIANSAKLVVGYFKSSLRVNRDCTLFLCTARLFSAPVGADAVFNILQNGISLWSLFAQRVKIINGQLSGETSAFTTKTLTEGDILTFYVDQIGSPTAGTGITLQLDVNSTASLTAPTPPPDP